MITNIALLEHPEHVDTLYPFSILHVPWELRFGAMSIVEAWEHLLGARVVDCIGRSSHIASFYARYPQYATHQIGVGKIVVISSKLLPTSLVANSIIRVAQTEATRTVLVVGKEIVGLICPFTEWEQFRVQSWDEFQKLCTTAKHNNYFLDTAQIFHYLWDFFDLAGTALTDQFLFFKHYTIDQSDFLSAHVATFGSEHIAIGTNSTIGPFVVLDASQGPIIIGNNVTIMSQTTICGPCAIGDDCLVKAGTRIYPHTIIGPVCKVSGEIECSIFQGFSNKQHDGFLGHSFISEWVNLGANTITSNLKNTYRPISVEFPTGTIATGRTFLGMLCGDHTKTGINTMVATGTVTGVCANVFGSGYTPQRIDSFTWGAIDQKKLYSIETALDVARRAMARRSRMLLPEEESLLRAEFEKVCSVQAHVIQN